MPFLFVKGVYMINFSVQVKQNGQYVPISGQPVFPYSYANLLDERLNEAYVTILGSTVNNYKPTTPIRITVNENNGNAPTVFNYVVARCRSYQRPMKIPESTLYYENQLYLIEPTKLMEGIYGQTITFTNTKGNIYSLASFPVTPQNISGNGITNIDEYTGMQEALSKVYYYPVNKNTTFTALSINTVFQIIENILKEAIPTTSQFLVLNSYNNYNTSVTIQRGAYSISTNDFDTELTAPAQGDFGDGNVVVTYTICIEYYQNSTASNLYNVFNFSYTISEIADVPRTKLITIKDVIDRILKLAKPIYYGETPLITLNSEQAEQFDNILAPEFTMTECTLREQLKVVGGFIHAEPRLDENFVLYFDDYVIPSADSAQNSPYIYREIGQDINQYCTSITTSAKNLVNVLGYASGVICSPNKQNYRTVRTESINVRVTESNGIVYTDFPIMGKPQVYCGLYDFNSIDWLVSPVDITPFIYEKTEYDSNLSSYDTTYPTSKAYGIYYTQGEKGLGGLFFKVENAVSSIFENYAIVNILSSASGVDVKNYFSSTNIDDNDGQYPLFAFQIIYTPIYSAKISHGKNYIDDEVNFDYTAVYNQQENMIESSYFGENMKGVAARLGNVEETRTYIFGSISDIPKVGMMIDGYTISAVSVEVMPKYYKVTVGLAKDFNRISEYVGISSVKRVYEVSEREAYQRNILLKEYLVVGDVLPSSQLSDSMIFNDFNAIMQTFNKPSSSTDPVTVIDTVTAWGAPKTNQWGIPSSAITATNNGLSSGQYEIALSVSGTPLSSYTDVPVIVRIKCFEGSGTTTTTKEYTFTTDIPGTVYIPSSYISSISEVIADVISEPCNAVDLPVVASALGNSIVFSWNYKDNYSAGTQVRYINNGSISGFFQQDVPYCDFYGKMYYYNFMLYTKSVSGGKNYALNIPLSVQGNYGNISTLQYSPYMIIKDSRESINFNYTLEYVSNRKGLIIGSALAANCPLITENNSSFVSVTMAYYAAPLSPYEKKPSQTPIYTNTVMVSIMRAPQTLKTISVKIEVAPGPVPACEAWAILSNASSKTILVTDEDGNQVEQTITTGGEVMLMQNISLQAGQSIDPIYITPVHDIYSM